MHIVTVELQRGANMQSQPMYRPQRFHTQGWLWNAVLRCIEVSVLLEVDRVDCTTGFVSYSSLAFYSLVNIKECWYVLV